jgi:hypothetical protein
MFLDHIAAFLNIEPQEDKIPLRVLAKEQMKISQIICHNIYKTSLQRNDHFANGSDKLSFMLMPAEKILVMPEAILFRAVLHDKVTEDGNSLNEPHSAIIQNLVSELFEYKTLPIQEEIA